jgi:hypothetical protein
VQRAVAVERAADGRVEKDSERSLLDRFRALPVRAVAPGAQIKVVVPDQHLRYHRVGELEPAGLVEEEVVL